MLGFSVTESKFNLDYEGTKNRDFHYYVTHKFSAGGYTWAVHCHPHGPESDNSVYLSLNLQLLDGSANVEVIFEAFVMDRRGDPAGGKRFVRQIPPGGYWGFPHFMEQEDLEWDFVVDGQASFVFVVTVPLPRDNPIAVPPSDIGDHLGSLLDSAQGSDVSFSVGGDTFPAHRSVLAARSPVFKAQLLGSMADAKMDCITLHEIQPATFQALLRFIYTDALPGDLESSLLQSLLAAADMYHMERLKLVCSHKLCKRLSTDTVSATLRFAEWHNCPELKNACIDFFLVEKNFKKAVLTEGYMRLMQSSPSIIDEIRERIGN